MIIAIDGPSGAGKGTLARKLAEVLGYSYLDTGLLYRATGHKIMQLGYSLQDPQKAALVASQLTEDDFKNEALLRSEVVAAAASQVAAMPDVRAALLQYQRDFANRWPDEVAGVVLDGRDIGTVVCPDATLKLFITASLEERAKRRLKDLQIRGIESIYENVLEDVRARDERDSKREASPAKASDDACVIDTSGMTIDDVFEKALQIVEDTRRHL